MRRLLAVSFWVAFSSPAWSQSTPTLTLGQVWAPGQFMAEFASKQDYIASVPANEVLAGPSGAAGAPTYRALTAADIPGAADGSQTAPGMAFLNDVTTGIYRDATSKGLRFTVGGQDRWAMDDIEPVNASGNTALAPTFFGATTWHSAHSIHSAGHIELTGYTAKDVEALERAASEMGGEAGGRDESDKLKDSWQIIVECESESQQVRMLDRFEQEGLKCRALI